MKRNRHFRRIFLLFLVFLVGLPAWLTYVAVQQEGLNQALVAAVKRNDAGTVGFLLKEGADANARQEPLRNMSAWKLLLDRWQGERAEPSTAPTALLLALCMPHEVGDDPPQNWTVAKMLVQGGANVNMSNDMGKTPLMHAVWANNRALVRFLLDHGAHINASDNYGETALMAAVLTSDLELISILLHRGANVNAQDDQGQTALMYAISMRNNPGIVRLLLRWHADYKIKDHDGDTALSFVISAMKFPGLPEDKQIIRLLKQAGAKE